MGQENEIIMFLLGAGVYIFILLNLPRLKQLPSFHILFLSYSILLFGWILTILEGFWWTVLLNLLEHVCYAATTVLLAIWCWRAFGERRTGE